MKLVILSDTHNKHRQLTIPEGDVLIHCGDFTGRGHHGEVRDFLKWFAAQPFEYRILIAGNHDLNFERQPEFKKEALEPYQERITYLENSGVEIEGINFWGSPYTPEFNNWAFNMERDGEGLRRTWGLIPDKTDVLITHGPPHGILDECLYESFGYPKNGGCKHLLTRLYEVRPKFHLFGHIHERYGFSTALTTTLCVNASNCDLHYKPVNKPVELHIDSPLTPKPQDTQVP